MKLTERKETITLQPSISKIIRVVIGIAIAMMLNSCKQATEPNNEVSYPTILTFSNERYTFFMKTWEQLNQKYSLNIKIPKIDSVLMVPDRSSLCQIDLFPDCDSTISLNDIKKRLYQFIDEWQILFNASSAELVEENTVMIGSIYCIDFQKRFPIQLGIKGWRSEIGVSIDITGKIVLFGTSCSPTLSVPIIPKVTSEKAKQAIIGKQLTYFDWTGQKRVTLTNDNLQNSNLVVALIPRFGQSSNLTSIEYRLCWEFKAPIFYVYVDAITGKDVDHTSQYIIF